MTQRKTAEKLTAALGTAALATVFALWCARSSYGAAGYTAAVVSALLMLALCLRFVPALCAFLRGEGSAQRLGETENGACLRIFLFILLWDAGILLLGFLLRRALGFGDGASDYLGFWLCTDSAHYVDIARDGYLSSGPWDRLVQLVFLPGYPLALRLFSYLTGDFVTAGLALSALCFAGSGCMLYKLLRLDTDESCAMRGVKFFALSPAAFFFAAPMSESLFILCTLSSLYLVRRGRLAWGGLLGAYAAFTRSPGLILVVPIVLELAHRRARAREYAAALAVPLGFAAYCFVNYLVAGDAFKFMEYQSVHWNQRLGWFFGTAAYQTENAAACGADKLPYLLGLWLPNLLAQLAALSIMLPAAKRLRASYTAYFIAYFVVTVGATWLLSAPRYLAAAVPVYAALALESSRKRTRAVLLTLSAAAFFAYFVVFLLRWQVW